MLIYPIRVQEEESPDSPLESIAAAVEDTLAVTLRFMRGYQVEVADEASPTDREDLAVAAEQRSADNIIFGSIRMDEEAYVAELSVYDRYTDEIAGPKSDRAFSVFETFDMADRLVAELVEDFSGVRVAYGSIRFEISGADDPYRVLIDGKEAGESLRRIEKLLIGEHDLEVVQERPSGEEVLIERSLRVEEGELYRIPLELPFLTQSEREEYSSLDRQLVRSYTEQLALNSTTLMMRGQSLTSKRGMLERGASMGFDGYERLLLKYRNWERLHEHFIDLNEDRGRRSEDLEQSHLSKRFSQAVDPQHLSFSLASLDEGSAARKQERTENLRELDRNIRFARNHAIPRVDIDFDGELEDWEDYEARAYEGEYQRQVDELVDIEAVFLGLQEEYLVAGINQSPGSGMLTNSKLIFTWEDERLEISTPLAVSREAEIQNERESRIWYKRRGVSEFIGRCEARLTMDGYEIRVPVELLREYIVDRPLELEVASEGTNSSDEIEAIALFIPGRDLPWDSAPAAVQNERDGDGKKRWLFPAQLGFVNGGPDGGSLFASAMLGVHYAFSERFFWGIDTLIMPTAGGGAPPALPLPGLIISSDNQTHLFGLNYLVTPENVFGQAVQFIAGSYAFHRFTFTAGVALFSGELGGYWLQLGYTL